MARNMRIALGLNFNVLGNSFTQATTVNGVRLLYSKVSLGIDGYMRSRDRVQSQFRDMADKFRAKMVEFADENSTNMIFTDDLKNMVHMLEKKPEDVELILKMIKKFSTQNDQMRFGKFVFGPIVLRAFYYLNEPDAALNAFKDPALEGFFDQKTSYQILLDLLYNHKKYTDMREVFEIVTTKHTDGSKHPRHSVVLVLGACYKQNTAESMKYAMNLWKELLERGHEPMRRAATFMAGLLLNQGSPHIALEIICSIRQINYFTVKNLKVAALADLDRLEDVVPLLRASLGTGNPEQKKQTYVTEVIHKVEAAMLRINADENSEIAKILRQLRQHGHIIESTLDEQLSVEIEALQFKTWQNNNREMLAASYDRKPRNNMYRRPNRLGLKDLV